jgi:Glucodextranase, domain N
MTSRVLGVVAGAAVVLGGLASTAAATPTTTTSAPGAPGTMSYFDLARKDCVGTARNTTSKVWFTVADGLLSDAYWPTVDATNVHTLQYLVSDGGTGGGSDPHPVSPENAGGNSALTDHGVPVAFNTNTVTNASNRDYAVAT